MKEAEELCVQVLGARTKLLGAEPPDTLRSMDNLAQPLSAQERLTEAEAIQEQVLKTEKKVLGAEHPDSLGSMHNLGRGPITSGVGTRRVRS